MKSLALFWWSFCLLAWSAQAQYFSAGWTPGQHVSGAASDSGSGAQTNHDQQTTSSAQAPTHGGLTSLTDLFDLGTLLTSAPAVSLFSRFGINITERVQLARQTSVSIWDERIPLITDDNYHDVIVNEPMSPQEEQDRTWVLIITVTREKQDGVSKYMDEVFDAAFNASVVANDLPNVRWGRIDYFNVTAITTKWGIWQAPYLVILRDRGRTLRFYRPHQLRLKEDMMRDFLRYEDWKYTPHWSTPYAPGGDREYIMDFLAIWLTRFYNTFIKIPRWLLFILSGSAASFVISLLHRDTPAKAKAKSRQQQPQQGAASSPDKATAAATSALDSPSRSKKRKARK